MRPALLCLRQRVRRPATVLALVGLAACASAPTAVPPDALDAVTVARFGGARALAASPDGTLYVVDADASAVVALGPGGAVLATFGGPGTGGGGLLDPVAVDPTNGQAVFVADAGAGTVTHYSAERRTVETVAIPEVDAARAARAVGPVPRAAPRGRPVAVAAGPDGSLYVAEAERGVVLVLDDQRGVARVLGASGPGALVAPVGLAVDDRGTLYVADRERGLVQTFDAFGAAGRGIPADGGVVSVAIAGERMLVVGPRSVTVHRLRGGVEAVVPVEAAEPLIGAALTPDGLFVLTRTRLVALGPVEGA